MWGHSGTTITSGFGVFVMSTFWFVTMEGQETQKRTVSKCKEGYGRYDNDWIHYLHCYTCLQSVDVQPAVSFSISLLIHLLLLTTVNYTINGSLFGHCCVVVCVYYCV